MQPVSGHPSGLRVALQAASLAALSGCSGPLSTLDPSGPAAGAIATLWWVMLFGSAVLFVLVVGIFILVVRRPGWGSSVSPTRWIVLGGLVLPAIVLLPLLAYGLVTGERLLPLAGSVPAQRIEAQASQWTWTFRYAAHGGVETRNVLLVPAGTPVDMVVTSKDVIHAFWVPRFAGKIDAVPGKVNRLRIQADQPGRYVGTCDEFCGIGHAGMRFIVIVHRPDDFPAALAEALTAPEAKQ